MVLDHVEEHKDQFGVEPICAALTSADAPSTVCAARSGPPSARSLRDE